MVGLNVSQTLLFNVGMDFFSIAVLLIIYLNSRNNSNDTQDIHLFRETILFLIWMLIANICSWLVNGKPGKAIRIFSYLVNFSYFLLQQCVVIEWMHYTYLRVTGRSLSFKSKWGFLLIPFDLIDICFFLTPWTKKSYYLDEMNNYQRGPLVLFFSLIILAYIISCSLFALLQIKKEKTEDRRKECLIQGMAMIPMVIGSFAQTFIYGLDFVLPCTTLSVLLVYLDIENRAVSQDALSGLNNRGNLDRYLNSCLGGNQDNHFLLMMMDINQFKKINDQYGHEMGDEAIMRMASILKETFNDRSVFLARYGGDEFTVVIKNGNKASAEKAIENLQSNINKLNQTKIFPFPLSVSVGYAVYPDVGIVTVNDLLKCADKNMYQHKNELSVPFCGCLQ